jgi:hypothetical protein
MCSAWISLAVGILSSSGGVARINILVFLFFKVFLFKNKLK